jgi:hypothetical protein
MGRREIVDLEANLFEEERRGCMAFLVGARKIGELEYEKYEDGGTQLKVELKRARLPEGTSSVTVLINDAPIIELDVSAGSGSLRLESNRGDTVPEVNLNDAAAIRAGDVTVCTGTFHRD